MFLTKRKKIGVALVALLTIDTRERKIWAKKWLKERKRFSHMMLLKELNSDDFRNYLRMDYNSFMELLHLVSPLISRQDTVMREAVSADERLVATLRYLATGRDYADLKFSTAISPQLLSEIVPETCKAIYKVLKSYIKIPATEIDWINTSRQFETMWQFNNCVGAMDGKHVLITKPPGSGSLFYNYKGTFSVVLFAVVNANYEFMYVHTGINGSVSDGGVLKHTAFYKKLASGDLNLPSSSVLPGTDVLAPYVFLGDNAFAMSEHLLKPFPQMNLTHENRIFNYRISRARRVTENVFGILSSRFRVFQKPILIEVENVDWIVLASCALHNFLRNKSKRYITPNSLDYEDINNETFRAGDWRQETNLLRLNRNTQRQNTEDGKRVRSIFTVFFNNQGKVDFQEKMCNVLGERDANN